MSEFRLVSGVKVPDLGGVHEAFDIRRGEKLSVFYINISAENIERVLRCFINQLEEPCFFVYEVPVNKATEETLQEAGTASRHGDVYYWDGLSRQNLQELIDEYGELWINDGLVKFGFATHHDSRDELYITKYKIGILYTMDEQRYIDLLREMGIPQEEQIKTVWNNFTQDKPGEASVITVSGKSIYDVLEELIPQGLYFAERREQ